MAKKTEDGDWIDRAGKAVPPTYVKPHDKARDRLVESLIKKAEAENARLQKLAVESKKRMQDFLEEMFEKQQLQPNKGGNYTLNNFSGDQQVCIKVHQFMEFDERIEMAKALIDECIEAWSSGASDNLVALVNDAFRVRGNKGLDVRSVLGLKKINVKDKTGKWTKAMKLIDESLQVVNSKSYIQFKKRPGPDADWETIRLDIAAVL